MRTPFTTDPTAAMTPAQHAELRSASTDPIGTAIEATATLSRLETAASRIDARIKKAALTHADETALPDSLPEETRAEVVRDAETRIAETETSSRRDLAILTARARSIVSQLEEAASEPDLSAVPNDILDGANRFLPLVQSQLAGASLPSIQKRLQAAMIRDDQSELLALSMAIGPILAEHRAGPDDQDTFLAYDLKGSIRQITARWRDRSLDAALDQARATAGRLDSLDRSILDAYQERSGGARYGFLDDFYGAR